MLCAGSVPSHFRSGQVTLTFKFVPAPLYMMTVRENIDDIKSTVVQCIAYFPFIQKKKFFCTNLLLLL